MFRTIASGALILTGLFAASPVLAAAPPAVVAQASPAPSPMATGMMKSSKKSKMKASPAPMMSGGAMMASPGAMMSPDAMTTSRPGPGETPDVASPNAVNSPRP